MTPLHLNQGNWSFIDGRWTQDPGGVITAPVRAIEKHMAFYTDKAYGDLDAEFEFRRDAWHAGVGLIVRAQDPQRYYVAEAPFCGQQIREGHFWAAITRADANGWSPVLRCERVPSIICEGGIWLRARVTVRGHEIRMWVNDRPLPPVTDDTHPAAGRIGLFMWGQCSVRNLRISGTEVDAPPWDESITPVTPWFTLKTVDDERHGTSGPTRDHNGGFVMTVNDSFFHSADQGRTWQKRYEAGPGVPEPDRSLVGVPVVTRDGRTLRVQVRTDKPFTILVAESTDGGRTWSDFQAAGEATFPDAINVAYMYGHVLELRDGTLLYFGHTYQPPPEDAGADNILVVDGTRYRPAQVPGWMNFCIRSEDGGRSWSDAIDLNGRPPDRQMWMSFKDQASETTAVELTDGEIFALVRPGMTWAMWETRSPDNGRTWQPLTAGPFLSYACAAPPRVTASGAIVIGGRFPAMAIYVSRDNGITWQIIEIDTQTWAMGGMVEVAPDVVLWVYGSGTRLRGQYIRITDTGVEPALDMLPKS